ncbi:MAG: preprotein translocase subunit SecE [Planctomycetes bacterium]|nr:preprotein translocase subunit SecE [Planctomycetota bacterium]
MYKAGQGMLSRTGTMVVGALIACYAALSWNRWRPFAGYGIDRADFIVTVLMLMGICGVFAWLVFRSPSASDYLIDMDDELRKVVWPSVLPLFDSKTEAWGSTYVVIVCAIFFTIFIWVADILLQLAITQGLFQSFLFAE